MAFPPALTPPQHDGDDDDRKGGWKEFLPQISDLRITNTSRTSLTLAALVNITNPTAYSASVPYMDIHILVNGSLIGHATARNLDVREGKNENLLIHAVYAPFDMGGYQAKAVGRELLSQYISGWNTSITLRTHEASIPNQPDLGRALSHFPIEVPTPKLGPSHPAPSDPDDDPDDDDEPEERGPDFIRDATFHLLTSTATFTLFSPLAHSTVFITALNATAYYHADPVGRIEYELPFAVPPVDDEGQGAQTPHLPVDWSLGSVGFEAVKNALGGTLKMEAEAEVGVRVGEWREGFWFRGKGIGAGVRL